LLVDIVFSCSPYGLVGSIGYQPCTPGVAPPVLATGHDVRAATARAWLGTVEFRGGFGPIAQWRHGQARKWAFPLATRPQWSYANSQGKNGEASMNAHASGKKALVQIDAARRRLRPPAAPYKPNHPRVGMAVLALAATVAATAAILASSIALHYMRLESYVAAVALPLGLIVTGLAPLAVLIFKRRRGAGDKRSTVIRLVDRRRPAKQRRRR
jgi:hypothetical protein